MASVAERRQKAVSETVARIKEIERAQGVTRASLEAMKAELLRLASRKELFPPEHFPLPETQGMLYTLAEDPDHRFTLYLNACVQGKSTAPHNHSTWAVVAGIEGDELNRLYRRTDDGATPGKATIELDREIVVGTDGGIALMPDDIHSIHVVTPAPVRHLHMYGVALPQCDKRLKFNKEKGTCEPIPLTDFKVAS